MERVIFLIDMQSFYANVEKLYYSHLQHKPKAVAGDPSIRSGVILAACPIAKREGVKTAETNFHRQAAQGEPINDGKAIYEATTSLFRKH